MKLLTEHFFVIDSEFDYENASPKEMIYNEIFLPIIDKYIETDDNKPKSYKCTKKSHSRLIPKTFIPL